MRIEWLCTFKACMFFSLFFSLVSGIAVSDKAAAGERPLRDVIDEHVHRGWETEKITPAPMATDSEFLRRVYLDLVGSVPTYEETQAFLANSGSDKRAKLIDHLLEDPRYSEHQGTVWDLVLFGRNPPGIYAGLRPTFQKWIKQQFRDNVNSVTTFLTIKSCWLCSRPKARPWMTARPCFLLNSEAIRKGPRSPSHKRCLACNFNVPNVTIIRSTRSLKPTSIAWPVSLPA